jgi:CCR4-NOT transcription complex subunit 4
LNPSGPDAELPQTLRENQFFGQYGKIVKISISNRKTPDGRNQPLGVYVTYETAAEADKCISAIMAPENQGLGIKAQHGTTKYCSAWLRHEQCMNKNCMFLHELGDEEDSYTRQDLSSLSSMNMIKAQYAEQPPATASGPSRAASRQQPTGGPSSRDGLENDADGSALPSSANWARSQGRSRRGSYATSGAASSPAISTSLPATTEPTQEAIEESPIAEDLPTAPERKASKTNSGGLPQSSIQAMLRELRDGPDFLFKNLNAKEVLESYPPLFDVLGGEKRRIMREEEEARLVEEQEDAADAPDASEGEPEESGSLALGGEPEDQDRGRDPLSFDQRRPGAQQPPIQRNNDALFGPSMGSNFGQSSGNVGSIGSRTITPQQQPFIRPQSGFTDNMPPGISSAQSSAFQHQGHNRQGSRFNFGAESGSSASMKVAANPRFLAQQSSMMPSSFSSQPGSQYYGTSMPGPPPGLKSTGTPPSMFGQGRTFGGASFGATTPKDSDPLLQSIIRGNNQSHESGKREYLNSLFSNQYPPSTSSTPTPASGVSASLFGPHLGAFQDFGSKQKKKGKKHRHANTSSSGGSGLVDLADPSILQARMQHQSQGSAGVGQGLFGGQSQGGYTPNVMYNNGYARW